MSLNETQYKILEGIRGNLRHGDIKTIATNLDLSKEYVSRVLSIANDEFNDSIVKAAIEYFSKRDLDEKALLKKLPAQLPGGNNNTQEPQLQETH